MNQPNNGSHQVENGTPGEEQQARGGLRAWFRRLFGQRNGSTALRETIEELIEQEQVNELPADSDELVLLANILKLHGLTVHDVMVPRADISAVDVHTSLPDLVRIMSEEAHSRIPVYRGTLDDVAGMVHIKDVLACWNQEAPFRLGNIVRRMLFVAPSMQILELLLQMRVNRIHMALVVDEYGGVDGLVTIEDLVEEIVGEIEDEHDEDETPTLTKRSDGSFDADARVPVEDFEVKIGTVLTDEERQEDIDTIGGLVFFLAGRVPGRGEIIRHGSGLEFQIVDADPRRIRTMRICNLPDKNQGE